MTRRLNTPFKMNKMKKMESTPTLKKCACSLQQICTHVRQVVEFQGKDVKAGNISSIHFYQSFGRRNHPLGPLGSVIGELGFHGYFGDDIGEEDEKYPQYEILYETNVFREADLVGMAKECTGVVDVPEPVYRADAAMDPLENIIEQTKNLKAKPESRR